MEPRQIIGALLSVLNSGAVRFTGLDRQQLGQVNQVISAAEQYMRTPEQADADEISVEETNNDD